MKSLLAQSRNGSFAAKFNDESPVQNPSHKNARNVSHNATVELQEQPVATGQVAIISNGKHVRNNESLSPRKRGEQNDTVIYNSHFSGLQVLKKCQLH